MSGAVPVTDELVVDVGGFEGPMALLLELARAKKIDLKQISILALAEQYLDFIAKAHANRLELATEYLLMAAWLAYLKSRLLLPEPPADDEPAAEVLAELLAFRLQRLAAMQAAGAALLELPRLGHDRFGRGAPEGLAEAAAAFECGRVELLSAYRNRRGRQVEKLTIRIPDYFAVADAVRQLTLMLGTSMDWRPLVQFLPTQWMDSDARSSAMAAFFSASLELGKAGKIDLAQDHAFAPLMLRVRVAS